MFDRLYIMAHAYLLSAVLVYLIFASLTLAARIPSTTILNNTANKSSTLDSLLNGLAFIPGVPVCSSPLYGSGLDSESCHNAYTKIPRIYEKIKYGALNYRGSRDYVAPIRYLSDDGLCAIDVTLQLKKDHSQLGWDITTGIEISERVEQLLYYCVAIGIGGAVKDYCES